MNEDKKSKAEEDVDSDLERLKQEIEGEDYVPNREGRPSLQIKIDGELEAMLKKIQDKHRMNSKDLGNDNDIEDEKDEMDKEDEEIVTEVRASLRELVPEYKVEKGAMVNCDVDDLWQQYLMDAPEEDKNATSAQVQEDEQGLGDEMDSGNPFTRKIINRAAILKNPNLMAPRAPSDDKEKIIKAPIYDLLVERINFHTSLIQEYALRKMLMDCRKELNDK